MQHVYCILLALFLSCPLYAENITDFLIFNEHERHPENNIVRYWALDHFYGRFHTNAGINVQPANFPTFHQPFSQVWDTVIGLPEFYYDQVFPGGYTIPADPLEFPDFDEVRALAEFCETQHRFAAFTEDSLSLTTWLQFDHGVYHVAQYAAEQVQELDTLYAQDWESKRLPQNTKLLWVQGVARLQGIVAGQVTLIASDSLFITGDLITTDTRLDLEDLPEEFGRVPRGSSNRIGLIGLKDVIIAASPANGLGNSNWNTSGSCVTPYDPVITVGEHSHSHMVLTAAVLALGCSFECEYWKTTTAPVSDLDPNEQSYCGGANYTQLEFFDCSDYSENFDVRGELWVHGSCATQSRGRMLIYRNEAQNPWGDAIIGYASSYFRHESNFLESTIPFWPVFEWIDVDPPMVTLNPLAQYYCETIADPISFSQDFRNGQIALIVTAVEGACEEGESLVLSVYFNGFPIAQLDTILAAGQSVHFAPEG